MADGQISVSAALLADIKNELDITWSDQTTDAKTTNYIRSGIAYLNGKYGGEANYEQDGLPRTLLFEYCRYSRDGALDVFENNYLSLILAMQNDKAVDDEKMESTAET